MQPLFLNLYGVSGWLSVVGGPLFCGGGEMWFFFFSNPSSFNPSQVTSLQGTFPSLRWERSMEIFVMQSQTFESWSYKRSEEKKNMKV